MPQAQAPASEKTAILRAATTQDLKYRWKLALVKARLTEQEALEGFVNQFVEKSEKVKAS